MKNTLKWTNRSVMPFTTKIYRGTAPLDRANLTNPIATLTAGESTYEDTVTRGTTNYYVIETIKGSDKQSSNNIPILALPRRGPGPLQLKFGDFNYGYFGTVPARDFVATQSLVEAAGLTGKLGIGAIQQESPYWHKFVRNGKILFVPNGPLLRAINWKILYDNGLVFGVDGPGPYNAGANVNQNKRITLGTSVFKIRLMTGYDDNLANFPPNETVTEAVYPNPCEWNDLVYPLSEYVPNLQRMVNVQQGTRAQLSLTGTAGTSHFCQERIGGSGNCFVAGVNQESRSCIAQRSPMIFNGTTTSNTGSWWPVLELVEG